MTRNQDNGARPARPPSDGAQPARPPSNGARPARPRSDSAAASEPVRLRAGSGEDLLALVPHLLGFYPSRSLVVLGLADPGSRVHVTFRYDLPDPPEAGLAADIAEHAASVLRRERIAVVALVAYGPASLAAPALATTMEALAAGKVRFREVLRAEGGRFWSLLCEDPDCCPPGGRQYDPGSHPLAAALTEAGLQALPDREALARSLLPAAGSTTRIRRATRAAERRLSGLRTSRGDGEADPRTLTARAGLAAVQEAIRRYRAGGSITSQQELAWLAVLLADLRVRDDAWARMDQEHAAAHGRLWADVVRGAAGEYVPAPASLLAFAAWQSGNGALAAVAVDRALAARPGYSMARLLGQALAAGLPPAAATLPMTPEEVAASYDAQLARARRPGRPRQPAGGRGPAGTGPAQSASAGSRAVTSPASNCPSG